MSEAISFSLHFLILLLFHFLSFSLFPFSLFPFFLFFFFSFFLFFFLSFLSFYFFSSFNILKFLIAAKPQSFLIPHSTFHIYNILRAVA